MGGERACRVVGDAARRKRHHEGDRARWIGLRVRDYGPGRRRAGDERHELAAPHVPPLVRGITSYHIAKENAALSWRGDALSRRRFIDYRARPPPDAHALRPDALPRDIPPACGIARSEVPPSDTPPSGADNRAPHDPPGNTPGVCVAPPGPEARRLAEQGTR